MKILNFFSISLMIVLTFSNVQAQSGIAEHKNFSKLLADKFKLFGGKELKRADKKLKLSPIVCSLPANCSRIGGKSFRCCGNVILRRDGKMTSTIRTSSNRWQGFTGAMLIQLLDDKKRIIYEVRTPSYGVNGESSRVDSWGTTIPKDVVRAASYMQAQGIRASTNRTLKALTKVGKDYMASQGYDVSSYE